jgi:hypothetical protein
MGLGVITHTIVPRTHALRILFVVAVGKSRGRSPMTSQKSMNSAVVHAAATIDRVFPVNVTKIGIRIKLAAVPAKSAAAVKTPKVAVGINSL